MERSFVIPSVFEENSTEFHKVAENFVDGIRIMDFNGKDYLVGNLALREGNAPHKLINTSVNEIDYQLLAVTGLVVATMGRYSRLVVTVGFPYTTYQSYRKEAEKFMLNRFDINFDSRTYGGFKVEKASFQVDSIEIMTEIDGCVKAIREGSQQEKNNFFIASLGYGTFEIAQSMPKGVVQRTTESARGLNYAVNIVENELKKDYYLNLLTEQQIERTFQRGLIVLDRKRIDLKDLRLKSLTSYYHEVLSPAIKRKFSNEDYANTDRLYLVGGGAMYPELIEMFKEEFQSILEVIVYPEPYLCAGRGYCLQSMSKSRLNGDFESRENTAYVGLDIGNSNTLVYISTPDGKKDVAEY
ncbi:MAG: ParM/StbA family protein [Bacteroidota bacterium]